MIERGRFAPTPSGRLHIGSARTALAAERFARDCGARFALRIEDLDATRTRAGMREAMLEDLAWLGVTFDEGPERGPHRPYAQSERTALYREALATLRAKGAVYPCGCSRKEVEGLASAPHGLEPVYPGTCRDRDPDAVIAGAQRKGRTVAWRFRARGGVVSFRDEVAGLYEQDVSRAVGDFVVYRADGVPAYQLAVVVDDVLMEVTQVVRGDDLLASTPRQLLLYESLGATPPSRWAHVALVVNDQGQRLAKRDGSLSIAELRAAGVSAHRLRAALLDSLRDGARESAGLPSEMGGGPLSLSSLCARLPELAPLIVR